MNVLPKPVEDLIDALARFPGIGPKSAARIALYILKTPTSYIDSLVSIFNDIKNIQTCRQCFNFSDTKLCKICASSKRDNSLIMVVEDALDLLAIERTGIYNGVYHVLGGVISPMNGIGPDEIRIRDLLNRLSNLSGKVEVILATNPNIEGEATALFIRNEVLKNKDLKSRVVISTLARGLSTGADIDYIDSSTLERAYNDRTNF